MSLLYCLIAIFSLLLLFLFIELICMLNMKPAQALPDKNDIEYYNCGIKGKKFEELYLFLTVDDTAPVFSDEEVYSLLEVQSEYMYKRFDCADFRAQLLFKIYKDCGEKLNSDCKELIKKTFLDFKYFMDEPGDDSMCYWSENHQILFAVAEYLAGQEWQDEIFTNNGMTGYEHMLKAKDRIEAWMRQRFDFGFSEYLSNNYLAEDIAPMANYIAYSADEESVMRMKIIMDILWLDIALNSVNNRFVSISSRMYGNNKAGNIYGNSIQAAMNILWGEDAVNEILCDSDISSEEKIFVNRSLAKKPNHIVICFNDIVKKEIYCLPPAIKDIALSKNNFISKMSCGLSVADLKNEELIGQSPNQIMAQLGAEAFTNPEVIVNTSTYIKNNNMYRNSFVGYFRFLNLTMFRFVNWKSISKSINMMPHGIATGRGNVYTYKTKYYALSTSVCNNVDMCGAQEHIWSANISENLALFTTHPAGNGLDRYSSSPGYWIGNGRRPMSVQNKNVNITIYKLPKNKRFGETGVSSITHAYMPASFYDEFELCDNMVFARKNKVFVALISNGNLIFRPFYKDSAEGLQKYVFPDELKIKDKFDLCRTEGEYHSYITELSDSDCESYDEFKSRIRNNTVRFYDGGKTEYATECGVLSVSYEGDFSVNGISVLTEYDRYDSPFCKAKRKDATITVDSGLNKLVLDFNKMQRITLSI